MKFTWPESAQDELRAIALTEYGDSGVGDVRTLTGEWQGHFRLRVGD